MHIPPGKGCVLTSVGWDGMGADHRHLMERTESGQELSACLALSQAASDDGISGARRRRQMALDSPGVGPHVTPASPSGCLTDCATDSWVGYRGHRN